MESAWSGGKSPFAIGSKKLGMWLFIVSDTLTFSALLITYSYSRLTNPTGVFRARDDVSLDRRCLINAQDPIIVVVALFDFATGESDLVVQHG